MCLHIKGLWAGIVQAGDRQCIEPPYALTLKHRHGVAMALETASLEGSACAKQAEEADSAGAGIVCSGPALNFQGSLLFLVLD